MCSQIWALVIKNRVPIVVGCILLLIASLFVAQYNTCVMLWYNTPDLAMAVVQTTPVDVAMETHGNVIVCSDMPASGDVILQEEDQWQEVGDDNSTFVYSSHLDPRLDDMSVIRVWGLLRNTEASTRDGRTYYCRMIYIHERVIVAVQAKLLNFENPYRKDKYVTVQWECQLPKDPWSFPDATVSIATTPCVTPVTNQMLLHQKFRDDAKGKIPRFQNNFSVCLCGSLKHGYSDYHRLVEWFELNTMLGGEMFHIYNCSYDTVLDPYIQHYIHQGKLQVHQWKLPQVVLEKTDSRLYHFTIWQLAQEVLLNDCFYRNIYVTKMVGCFDIDENIAPTRESLRTWADMIDAAQCPNNTASYVARNAFFSVEKQSTSSKYRSDFLANHTLSLNTLLKTFRQSEFYKFPERSKYFAVPHKGFRFNNHHLTQTWKNSKECILDPEVGYLRHYRNDDAPMGEIVEDTSMYKYADELIERTKHVHDQIKKSK